MTTDVLPLSDFALESWGPVIQARGDGKTLTLRLALDPMHSSLEPMNGSASANQSLVYSAELLRAAVVPADGEALTITF